MKSPPTCSQSALYYTLHFGLATHGAGDIISSTTIRAGGGSPHGT